MQLYYLRAVSDKKTNMVCYYPKLGSIVTGHSIHKLRIFAPPNSWVIVFMGLITTRLKIQ